LRTTVILLLRRDIVRSQRVTKTHSKQQFWSDTLASAESSGLSLADFARQNHLDTQDLYRWRNKLKHYQQRTEQVETKFFKVLATSMSSAASLSITIGCAQPQFGMLPDPR